MVSKETSKSLYKHSMLDTLAKGTIEIWNTFLVTIIYNILKTRMPFSFHFFLFGMARCTLHRPTFTFDTVVPLNIVNKESEHYANVMPHTTGSVCKIWSLYRAIQYHNYCINGEIILTVIGRSAAGDTTIVADIISTATDTVTTT